MLHENETHRAHDKPKEISRRKFLLGLTAGVATGMLAWGVESDKTPKNEKTETPPKVDLEALISDPESYMKLTDFSTEGYPEQFGIHTDLLVIPIIVWDSKTILSREAIALDTYRLHTTENQQSPSMPFLLNDQTVYYFVPLNSGGLNMTLDQKYQITGKLTEVQNEQGINYQLQANSVTQIREQGK